MQLAQVACSPSFYVACGTLLGQPSARLGFVFTLADAMGGSGAGSDLRAIPGLDDLRWSANPPQP